MKFYSALVFGWGSLVALTSPLYATPRTQTRLDAGKVSKNIKVANKPSLSKKVGERIRLTMWAEGLPRPKFSNQMQDTSPYKSFGTLLVGGETWWSVAKPQKGEYGNELNYLIGQRIEISSDSAHNGGRAFVAEVGFNETQWRDFKVLLTLYDFPPTYLVTSDMTREKADDIHRQNDYNYDHPPLMGHFEQSFDLSKMKGDYVWTWSDGKKEGSKLHLRIEHVGYLYSVDYPRLDPAIEKSKLPARVPGPGPISNISKPRIGQPSVKKGTQR